MNMKTRILFLLHMPPPVHGAALVGKYIHDSRLVGEAFDCRYINMGLATSLEDIGRGGIGKYLRYLGIIARAVGEVVRYRPQMVYVTPTACGGGFYKDFVVVELMKLLGRRVVVHFHNKGVATRQDRRMDDWMYRRFFRGIKVILLAEALYGDVRKYVKREDVFVCPNGIPEVLTEEPKAERHNAVPRLLFLSNLLVDKGVLVLLDALKILKERGYSFVCDFVGGETAEIDAARFRREVEARGLSGTAVYLGRKFGEEKNEVYGKADVFVFPTFYHNECFPLVLLEAMQHGLPCLSTDEGGIPSIIDDGKTGWTVPRHDAEALAEKMEYLLKYPEERIRMGEDGYRKYRKEFTLEGFERRFVKIMQEINGEIFQH